MVACGMPVVVSSRSVARVWARPWPKRGTGTAQVAAQSGSAEQPGPARRGQTVDGPGAPVGTNVPMIGIFVPEHRDQTGAQLDHSGLGAPDTCPSPRI